MNVSTLPYPVRQGQRSSTLNSQEVTATEAQPGVPWVGGWELTRDAAITRLLTVLAATDPTIGGTFTFEFSEDGITATISEERPITDFDTVRDFDLINAGAYYRVKFEPAAPLVTESVFINTTLRTFYDGAFVRLGNQELEEINAALPANFAYLKGFRTNGKSIGITATRGGAVLTASEGLQIARGNVAGAKAVLIAGRNPDIDVTSDPEDVTMIGGLYTGHPTSGTTTATVSSSSVSDTAAGIGARTMVITGLTSSAATEFETEVVTLAGVTPVVTTKNWYRIVDVEVASAGSTATNAGTITVTRTAAPTVVFASIAAGAAKSQLGVYTVPADQRLFVGSIQVSLGRANGSLGSANIALQRRHFGSGVWVNVRDWEVTTSAHIDQPYPVPLVFEPLTDLRFRVLTVSDSDSIVNVEVNGVRYDI